jgi:hypothetical protein
MSAFAERESNVKIDPGGSIEVWPAGLYEAKVVVCEAAESVFPGREGQPRFKWIVRVRSNDDPDEFNDVHHYTNTTLSTHPNAKLRPFLKALQPTVDLDDLDVAENLDTDDYVGKRCRVVLGVNEEKGRNTIDKVLPPETAKTGTPTRPAKAAVEVPPF